MRPRRSLRGNRYVQDASLPFLSLPAMGNTNYYRPVFSLADNLAWHALGEK